MERGLSIDTWGNKGVGFILRTMHGRYDKLIDELYFYKRKDGKQGKLCSRIIGYYTPLFTCELCGKVSTPFKVHEREDVIGWDWGKKGAREQPSKTLLCTGCWNKVKPISKRREEACLNSKLINKAKREVAKCRKLQTVAR